MIPLAASWKICKQVRSSKSSTFDYFDFLNALRRTLGTKKCQKIRVLVHFFSLPVREYKRPSLKIDKLTALHFQTNF